jgi:L-cysteine:1D-myo-inositol 2-amino-2-deoxy-alpha-D-glucopyranoside ligase
MPSLEHLGRAPAVRVHDTAARELRSVEPVDGPVRLYVCGITPYDATHIGHAATYLGFDLLHRAWRDAGHEVRYVQNVTDVDDPLLERADRDGEDWRALADREIERFRRDMAALKVLPPDAYVGVVESVDLVAAMVVRLRDEGHAYLVEEDWYFDVHSDPDFGAVSRLDEAAMLQLSAERGGDPERPGKRHPLDCLLWRAERPGEPAWPSPLGPGRPGWHVECSAIALAHLGGTVDVQGGGSDLVFPHHEMSASEAQVARPGEPFARSYVHGGMVAYEGRKMSKSLGNLVFVSTLREAGVDPTLIRLAIVAHHYRSDWEWTDADLRGAEERLAAWPRALSLIDAWAAEPAGDGRGADLVRDLVDARLGVAL